MDNNLYVRNEENFIYKIGRREKVSENYDSYTLELICGVDYINPDENDMQGYVNNKRFTDDIQTNIITVNVYNECLKYRLLEEGYQKINNLPKIY